MSGPLPTMHVAKQGHREAKGSDSMILQRVEEIGITKKRELSEKLKALIAKEMAGSALAGKPKRCLRCESADFCCKRYV